MGQFSYAGGSVVVDVDDRVLSHLRLVTVTKLRRAESFPLTLPLADGGTETLWMHASIPMRFTVEVDEVELQRPMLVKMMSAASGAGGLNLASADFARLVSPASVMHAVA
ncbi:MULTISPECIES: DUF7882 family protein [Microbacterium]|uniref:DUF7882 domain-containing protein n=2 Tax=Microbacterium maritypicum TaxID=33918 RepID=A0AAJ5VBU7_MICMQ|nr:MULTISPECIES: hypothetical protein [Microbacterium]EYT57694.1 hypothetical protein D514_0116195 [Microbacterium sp. UCD-TDU]MBP5803711.1 hypothetical protein [Microbacterium liquefaciens]UTT53227.1 hypothetical protein NMQ05_01230 [Microbacterium liquefaciens]WEF21328.1 hypothetical protein PWF71_01280 [Microbacterium liquefaciens]